MSKFSDIVLILLQLYFLTMTFTVERSYCHAPFTSYDTRFLVQETIIFCEENNRLFLARPDWMVAATCAHSYIFSLGYICIILITLTKSWRTFAVPVLLLIGAKMNAILFYHYMEFISDTPPENLVAYFSVEGPYILSMLLVIVNVYTSLRSTKAKGE